MFCVILLLESYIRLIFFPILYRCGIYIRYLKFSDGNIPPPLWFGRFKKLGWCRCGTDRGFTRIKSDFYNVNLPAYTLAPAAPYTIIQTANKPQIGTIQADFSHFPGVTLKCINEAISN